MEEYYGLVEFAFAGLFIMAWAVMEWQGRRLDRKKEAEKAEQQRPASSS